MEEQISTGTYAKKWGLIYGLITTIIVLIPTLLETQMTWVGFVPILVAILCYVMATREFKQDNGGYMSFGEGFKICITAALIAGVLRSVINYVYVKFIDPGVQERIQETLEDQWREQGMSQEQIDSMQSFSAGFSNPEVGLVIGIIVVLLGGLIWGSIVSAINKNEAEDF